MTFPVSREYLALADLIEITVAANMDSKNNSNPISYPRPWEEAKASADKEFVQRMTLADAKEYYAVERSTLSKEEILEKNRIFTEEQRKLKEENG